MNWSLIILGLVALSSVAIADNSYLIFAPKLFKVGYDNQLSFFIAAAPQPVEVKYILTVGPKRVEGKVTVNAGETRNATLALPTDFPCGPGELTMVGTGGVRFEEKRDLIVYDNRHVMLVQTSASTYRPGDMMEIRVVVTDEELTPMPKGEVLVEIYDGALKLIGRFPRVLVNSGLTETIRYPISEHNNIGTWLVSATIGNTTSSLEVLVAEPMTPSFDLKAIFPRFILRSEKNLRGVIEIDSDANEAIFGRAFMAVGPMTEEDVERMRMEKGPKVEKEGEEVWRKWKHQEMDVAGRIEFNYEISSMFNIDITKVLALRVYVRVEDLASGQERIIEHVIPVFTRDVVYDIRPLEFTAGIKNEFQILAKRPDGKPAKMEDMIVTVTMMIGDDQGKVKEEKSVEVKEFYTRGRNDVGFFNVEVPENCIGVLMTITPLGDDGKIRGYRTHAVPLMPTPRREVPNGKLTIELLPSTVAPAGNDPKAPLVSAQISKVGETSKFYIQLLPTKPVEKMDPLPVSYILMSNGRIIGSGEFSIKPTKECQSKTKRSIKDEEQRPPTCVYNGTLPIEITRAMVPYSTLLVYCFQPSLGFNLAESYRFSVAGLFRDTLTLNATIVPYSIVNPRPEQESEELDYSAEEFDGKPITISSKAQDKNRVQLSLTGTPNALVGLNVIEYDGVMQGLSSEVTKERLLNYLTTYEQVPIIGMPSRSNSNSENTEKTMQTRGVLSEEEESKNIERESMGFRLRYPLEKMVFGVNSLAQNKPIESDDAYATGTMDRFYGTDNTGERPSARSHYRRKAMKSMNQYDVTVNENDYVVATSYPLVFTAEARIEAEQRAMEEQRGTHYDEEIDHSRSMAMSPRPQGTPAWFEKMHSRLSQITPEALTFMQSGLNVISDFTSLRVPTDMVRVNLTTLFSRYRQQSNIFDDETFSDRDEARVVLEQYLVDSDLSMLPPPILLEEQARLGYYRSVYFNTTRIGSDRTSKVVLPRTKPYSTWLATGFSLHAEKGLAIAQPIRLPTNQGLFVLGSFVDQMRIGERALLTYGINNYLGKDLTNVVLRIHGSTDFDLMEGERVVSTGGKDYTLTIPSLKIFAVETRNVTVVPKRAGVIKIVIEVESEFGGDYEVLTTYVRESGIKREQRFMRLFDLTEDKKTSGPVTFEVKNAPELRSLQFYVSGTGLDRLIERYPLETSHLLGVDRAIIRLWRALGLRRYLNETSQVDSELDEAARNNITLAYQKLQLYSTYNGSYSFISDEGLEQSSFFLTTLSFGAMVSPHMTVRDNVTLNRTLTWLLAHQQKDGSFEDVGPCYHFRFCSGEFRREGLTALFYFTMTRDNISNYLPEFLRRRLFEGEQSPMMLAHRYLESRYEAVKSCMLTTSLIELAFTQSKLTSTPLREKILGNLRSRQLTVVPEDGSKFYKINAERVTYDDQLLVNAMMLSTYVNFGDYQTTSLIARWAVRQFEMFPYHDTLLDSIFGTEAWLRTDCLYRRSFSMDKMSIVVDVTTDNGQKQQFKVDRSNLDFTQKVRFNLPVKQITYTVSGFGFVGIEIRQGFFEKQQEKIQPTPFTLTNDFTPAPWLSEIKVKTCMTYTPTAKELQAAKETFNRTVVIEFELPSGTRINLRQIGFALSQVENVMYFTYDERARMLNFFVNMPKTSYGKQMCFEWILERLSYVMSWTSIQVHAYDYLQQDTELTRLFPIQFEPKVAGYAFIEAVHKARPSIEQLVAMQKNAQRKP